MSKLVEYWLQDHKETATTTMHSVRPDDDGVSASDEDQVDKVCEDIAGAVAITGGAGHARGSVF